MEFLTPLKNVTLTKLPADATFECEVSRIYPDVQWLRNDEPLRRSAKYEIASDGTHHRLTIRDVDGIDEGEYTLVVKNNRSTAKLAIEGMCITCNFLTPKG